MGRIAVDPDPARCDRRNLAAAAAVALLCVGATAARTQALLPGHSDQLRPWDHQKYAAMAERPFELRLAPFSWRILEPLLARALPFDVATSFRVLAFVGVWSTAIAMFVLVQRVTHRTILSWTGMLLFLTLGWVTGYPLYNVWLPDCLAGLAVAVLAIAAIDRRPVLFALVLVVGVLTKEQVLLAAPLWYTLRAQRLLDRRLLMRSAAVVAPAIGALIAVRAALPAGNGDPSYLAHLALPLNRFDLLPQDPHVLFDTFGRQRLSLYPLLVLDWSLGAFGTLGLFALVALRRNLWVAARWLPFLVGVYAQPLVASNQRRLIALAFPVVVIMAVQGIAELQARLRLADAVIVAVPLALLVPDLVATTNVRIFVEIPVVVGVLALGALHARRSGALRAARGARPIRWAGRDRGRLQLAVP